MYKGFKERVKVECTIQHMFLARKFSQAKKIISENYFKSEYSPVISEK